MSGTAMPRTLASLLTVLVSGALAVGAALGIVAALEATPSQPNTPLITYENHENHENTGQGR